MLLSMHMTIPVENETVEISSGNPVNSRQVAVGGTTFSGPSEAWGTNIKNM